MQVVKVCGVVLARQNGDDALHLQVQRGGNKHCERSAGSGRNPPHARRPPAAHAVPAPATASCSPSRTCPPGTTDCSSARCGTSRSAAQKASSRQIPNAPLASPDADSQCTPGPWNACRAAPALPSAEVQVKVPPGAVPLAAGSRCRLRHAYSSTACVGGRARREQTGWYHRTTAQPAAGLPGRPRPAGLCCTSTATWLHLLRHQRLGIRRLGRREGLHRRHHGG